MTNAVVALFHPRIDVWDDHFSWAADPSSLIGLTPTGRATVEALDLNAPMRTMARLSWKELGLLP